MSDNAKGWLIVFGIFGAYVFLRSNLEKKPVE